MLSQLGKVGAKMDVAETQDKVFWKDGVPVSTLFDDPYFSLQNGLAETEHVFLAGNDLPARFRDGFAIAELGFGTGLNALAALKHWRGSGQFTFTSFEAYPMPPADMKAALGHWPELNAAPLLEAWGEGQRRIEIGPMTLEVVVGDVAKTLPAWTGSADAWFLDGFSPAKNPEMWQPEIMAEVARHTRPDGSFATYTAASFVRQGLSEAGFEIRRIPGFGRKRHMTVGTL